MIRDQAAAEGRRERRKQATRRAIQLSALRLAVERGPDNVTVQAISDATDIAPRTFFTYFSSKEEALAVDRFWTAARLREVVAGRPADEPPLRSLREGARRMAADIAGDPERMRLFKELARRHPERIHRLVGTDDERVQVLIDAIAARTGMDPRRDAYPSVAAWSAWMAGQVAMQRWSEQSGEGEPPDRFVDEVFDLLERGL
jgi:AcrR family transcriptional regulator